MARATADIGTIDYTTALMAGHHALTADEGPAVGGKDTGAAPHELLCAALAACTAITLRMYAERKSWLLTSADIAERTPVTLTLKQGVAITTILEPS